MRSEFLIVCDAETSQNIKNELTTILNQILEESDVEYELDEILQVRYERVSNTDNTSISRVTIGFSIEIPDEVIFDKIMLDDFVSSLNNSDTILHIVKFEDSLLQGELSDRAKEIFAIEMKLRRILSLMYLSTYQDRNPYDFFIDGRFRPRPSTKREMLSLYENQFFHLDFRNYVNINIPRNFQMLDIMELLRNSNNYEEFRLTTLNALSLTDDRDVSFLEDLKQVMDPIEEMRNCVAHNRRLSDDVSQNYLQARESLEKLMKKYLEQWEVQGSS